MKREKSYIEDLKPYSNDYFTFGDGVKGRIKGISKLEYPCLPSLENVLLGFHIFEDEFVKIDLKNFMHTLENKTMISIHDFPRGC